MKFKISEESCHCYRSTILQKPKRLNYSKNKTANCLTNLRYRASRQRFVIKLRLKMKSSSISMKPYGARPSRCSRPSQSRAKYPIEVMSRMWSRIIASRARLRGATLPKSWKRLKEPIKINCWIWKVFMKKGFKGWGRSTKDSLICRLRRARKWQWDPEKILSHLLQACRKRQAGSS